MLKSVKNGLSKAIYGVETHAKNIKTVCRLHDFTNEFICTTCLMEVCSHCVNLEGRCKEHETMSFKRFNKKANQLT